MQQTTVQNSNTIRFGSGKVEVGPDETSLVDLGAMTGITFEESWDVVEVESDNAGQVQIGTSNHVAAISGDLMEFDLEKLAELRGGIDVLESVDGTEVTGETQTITTGNWEFDKFIPLENQNADGTENNVTDVSGSTAGSLTVDADYDIMENEDGEYGIIVYSDATNISTADQDITITFDYTPATAKRLSSGGKTEINPKVVRITNEDENSNKFQITIWKAKNQEGVSLELQADESGEPATTPINLEGSLDESRAVGKQLFEIYDEQGVA